MPELPEVEHLRLTLEPSLLGATIEAVDLRRADMLRDPLRCTRGAGRAGVLLAGTTVRSLVRHGKQLAFIGAGGAVVCVHLGMSGQMYLVGAGEQPPHRDHVHCTWHVRRGRRRSLLLLRDPRRFGGMWVYPSQAALLEHRWSGLGPDALDLSARVLVSRLKLTRRAIKAALLDQRIIAGIGNIYADECLHAARIDPGARSDAIRPDALRRLAASIRRILRHAIADGGSSVRTYVDALARRGRFALRHRVYGRGGQACFRCSQALCTIQVAQRTTVYCASCVAGG